MSSKQAFLICLWWVYFHDSYFKFKTRKILNFLVLLWHCLQCCWRNDEGKDEQDDLIWFEQDDLIWFEISFINKEFFKDLIYIFWLLFSLQIFIKLVIQPQLMLKYLSLFSFKILNWESHWEYANVLIQIN